MGNTYRKLDVLIGAIPAEMTMFIGWVDGYPRIWELVRAECDERAQARELIAQLSDEQLLQWAQFDCDNWRIEVVNARTYTGASAKLLSLLLAIETETEFERWKRLWDSRE